MEIIYDKAAILEYMDDIEGVGESVRRTADEGFAHYNSTQQQYSRLHTELEQAIRRAYNKMEAAESMLRAAQADYAAAVSWLNSLDEEDDDSAARAAVARAEAEILVAEQELREAQSEYDDAVENMNALNELWERYAPSMEASADKVSDGLSSFATLTSNANSDLSEYMGTMDLAQSALYDGATPSAGSGSSAPSAGATASGTTAAPISPSAFKTNSGNVFDRVGNDSLVLNVKGQSHSFPNTKSGAARAYRESLKTNDSQLISHIKDLFSSF